MNDKKNNISSTNRNKCDMKSIEHDHAWNYFKLHANQRIELFKCYIMFFTIFSTGIGYMLVHLSDNEDKLFFSLVAIIICLAFMLITRIFDKLDKRNRQLIEFSRESLRKFEDINFKKTNDFMIFTNDLKGSNRIFTSTHSKLFHHIYFVGKFIAGINITLIIFNLILDHFQISILEILYAIC